METVGVGAAQIKAVAVTALQGRTSACQSSAGPNARGEPYGIYSFRHFFPVRLRCADPNKETAQAPEPQARTAYTSQTRPPAI